MNRAADTPYKSLYRRRPGTGRFAPGCNFFVGRRLCLVSASFQPERLLYFASRRFWFVEIDLTHEVSALVNEDGCREAGDAKGGRGRAPNGRWASCPLLYGSIRGRAVR